MRLATTDTVFSSVGEHRNARPGTGLLVYAVRTHGMAVGTGRSGGARACPCCGRRYAFRLPARLDGTVNLCRHYRCGRQGAYVYVHEIEY